MKYNLLFFLFLSLNAFSQSKSVIIQQQQARIDSLTEALEIQKEEFAAAERRFERNNEKMKLIDQQIISWHDQYVNPYHAIDYHMAMCPKSIKKDPEQLVEYVKEIAHTDLEKCRAVYTWIAYNIKYDDVAYNNNTDSNIDPLDVIKEQKALCGGYSELFTYLCSKLNLEVKSISGYSKAYQYNIEKLTNPNAKPPLNHGWNFVKINGEWRGFDATWASGKGVTSSNGLMKFVFEYTDNWFNCSPEEFVFTHYPENDDEHFLKTPISLNDFCALPDINISAFKIGFLDAHSIIAQVGLKSPVSYPKIFSFNTHIKVINAPKTGTLRVGETYTFEFYIPRGKKVFASNEDKNIGQFNYSKESSVFTCKVTPLIKGELTIIMDYYNSNGIFSFLEYKVQ
jgi:hypothetical protein